MPTVRVSHGWFGTVAGRTCPAGIRRLVVPVHRTRIHRTALVSPHHAGAIRAPRASLGTIASRACPAVRGRFVIATHRTRIGRLTLVSPRSTGGPRIGPTRTHHPGTVRAFHGGSGIGAHLRYGPRSIGAGVGRRFRRPRRFPQQCGEHLDIGAALHDLGTHLGLDPGELLRGQPLGPVQYAVTVLFVDLVPAPQFGRNRGEIGVVVADFPPAAPGCDIVPPAEIGGR